MDALLRPEQVADRLGVTTKIASQLMAGMRRINVGTSAANPRWVVRESALEAWLKSREEAPTGPVAVEPRRRKPRAINTAGLLDEQGHIMRRR